MPAVVNQENCAACGACIDTCPAEAISQNADSKAVVDTATCSECGACVDACPVSAITL